MCHQEKHQNTMESQQIPSDYGPIQEKSSTLKHQEDIDDILSKIQSKMSRSKDAKSFIAELVARNNQKISIDKLNILGQNIQIMKLLQISEAESTSKEPVSYKSWQPLSMDTSKKLSLHIETDGPELDLNYLNGYFRDMKQGLKALIKKAQIQKKSCPEISWKSLPYTLQDIMDSENTMMRTLTIKISLTPNQKMMFDRWMLYYRALYNYQSELLYNSDDFQKSGKMMAYNKLRDLSLCKASYKDDYFEKSPAERKKIDILREELPSAIMDCVAQHVRGNYETCKSNNHYNHEQLCMKKKKGEEMFKISSKGWNYTKDGGFSILPKSTITGIPVVNKKDDRLLRFNLTDPKPTITVIKQHGEYYVAYPYLETMTMNMSDKVIAFDPGVRTFLTGADSTGKIKVFGKYIINRIDKFILAYKNPHENRKVKKRFIKSRAKIDRVVNDFHCKLAKFLAINYKAIIASEIGNYITHKQWYCAADKERCSRVRHANFTHRLKLACEKYDSMYLFTREHYTTKCCSQCKTGYYEIGSDKIYRCPNNCQPIDRDVNSARNILSRYVVLCNKK